MDQKYGEFIGVDSVYYAPITADTVAAYTPGTPVYLAPAAEIAGEPEVNNKTTYYDNAAANNYVTEGKTELTLTLANVPAALLATLLGKKFDTATGRLLDSGKANPPKLALGFRFKMGAGYRYYWYLAGTFSGGAEEAATQSADIDVKNYQLKFTAFTTTHEFNVGTIAVPDNSVLKRVVGDTADTNFDGDGWFSAVQVPIPA